MDAMENNELVNPDRRQSESPARTIDSFGSTVASMDTIVDRNEERLQTALDNSTNTTNLDAKNSLTNSQISIITKNEKNEHSVDGQQQQDAQSHIYSSPVYATNTPEKYQNQELTPSSTPKLITHAEFEKQQLTAPKPVTDVTRSLTATIDSKVSKKQRFPPELIKIKGDPVQDFKVIRRNCFPNQVTQGVVQLLLSIALVAMGSLLIVRGAALAAVGSGIWTGGIAAITGALGVINIRKVRTGFLALSLVCIASCTLALAISGVGLTRDVSKLEEKSQQTKLNKEKITAAYWLIFTLGLHLIVSVASVYKSASRLCSRSAQDEYDHMNNPGLPIDQETVEEYIKAMSLTSGANNLIKKDQIGSQLIYPSLKSNLVKDTLGSRSIILIPASLGNTLLPPPVKPMMRPPPYPLLAPPGMTLPPPPPMPMVYHGGMTLPHKRPGTGGRYTFNSYRPQIASMHRHRRHPHHLSPSSNHIETNSRHAKSQRRTGAKDNNSSRRQRRKSDTDASNRRAFTYTGLDKQIADSYLARQEQANGSHIDYTSSGESGGRRNDCPDIVM